MHYEKVNATVNNISSFKQKHTNMWVTEYEMHDSIFERYYNLDLEYNCDIHEQNVFANKKLSTRILLRGLKSHMCYKMFVVIPNEVSIPKRITTSIIPYNLYSNLSHPWKRMNR